MGKVGFRIRSKTGSHVPVYVNVYLCAGSQLEAKTGFVTNLTKWDTTFQRSNDNSLQGVELNEKLDKFTFSEIENFSPVKKFKNRYKCILLSFDALQGACEKHKN